MESDAASQLSDTLAELVTWSAAEAFGASDRTQASEPRLTKATARARMVTG